MNWAPKDTPGYLINRAARLIGRVADSRLKPLGLAAGQIPVLAALRDGAAMSQTALARLALIEQPTMAATLARMERDGLIERKPDAADGRSSLIRLSPTAIAKSPAVIAVLVSGREEMLAGFDDAERELLAAMMMRIIANLEQATQRDDPPGASSPSGP